MTSLTGDRPPQRSQLGDAGGAGRLSIGVLGPFETSLGGRLVDVTTGRLRAVLAVLAVSAGHPVMVDDLATRVWGEELPANARRSVQTYVTRLRRLLRAEFIRTTPAGYMLDIDPDEVDALRFLRLTEAFRKEPDPRAQRAGLAQALALWRGTPFAGVPSPWLMDAESTRLVEQFLVTLERRVDLDLAAGRHAESVAELSEVTLRHPLRESLWARLLVVLARCDRPAEALAWYETIRTRLADELGVEPGPELRRVFADLLAGRVPTSLARPLPAMTPLIASSRKPGKAVAGATARPSVPRQLPPDPVWFTGRGRDLDELDRLLRPQQTAGGASMVIVAIHGAPGVGKTALAVRCSHRAAGRFPDGQLYLNLRGWASTPPAAPIEALAGLLHALGEPVERIPRRVAEASALYRALLADRRVLVLLDNVRTVEQVRPLLPGSPGCAVLVTSRNCLGGLVAREGAHRVALDVLDPNEARALLARAIGRERAQAEPAAVAALAEACGHLPLALRIAAANIGERPERPVAQYVAELTTGNRPTTSQAEGEELNPTRATLDLSDAALEPEERWMFHRLGHSVGHRAAPAGARPSKAPGQAHLPKPFSAEFCWDAVAKGRARETPIRQIARDFGISESCLSRWLQQVDGDDGVRAGLAREESAELRELKRRNRVLERENEILRRAAAWFAKDITPK